MRRLRADQAFATHCIKGSGASAHLEPSKQPTRNRWGHPWLIGLPAHALDPARQNLHPRNRCLRNRFLKSRCLRNHLLRNHFLKSRCPRSRRPALDRAPARQNLRPKPHCLRSRCLKNCCLRSRLLAPCRDLCPAHCPPSSRWMRCCHCRRDRPSRHRRSCCRLLNQRHRYARRRLQPAGWALHPFDFPADRPDGRP